MPSTMPHLPNEIWILIISHCDSYIDQWLSLRLTNSQLKSCVEQYFSHSVVSQVAIELPVALPTYDIRSPVRGKAMFHPIGCGDDSGKLTVRLVGTQPDYYEGHFLGRWAGMRDGEDGRLGERVKWNVRLEAKCENMRLYGARAITAKEDCNEDDRRKDAETAALSFEWMPTMTGLLKG